MQKGVRGKNLAGRQQTSQGVRSGGGVRTLSTRAKYDTAAILSLLITLSREPPDSTYYYYVRPSSHVKYTTAADLSRARHHTCWGGQVARDATA